MSIEIKLWILKFRLQLLYPSRTYYNKRIEFIWIQVAFDSLWGGGLVGFISQWSHYGIDEVGPSFFSLMWHTKIKPEFYASKTRLRFGDL